MVKLPFNRIFYSYPLFTTVISILKGPLGLVWLEL